MKKLLALILALMMLQLPALSLAEGTDLGIIGGADGPTSLFVSNGPAAHDLNEAALSAGRRINAVLSIKELKGVQSGDPTVDAAINDLVASLGIAAHRQGDEGGLALQISGQDVLTLGGALSGNDLYINSNLLGGTVVVNGKEVEPLIGKFLDMFVLLEAMTAEEAAELKEILSEVLAEVEASMNESALPAMEMPDLEDLNYTALEKILAIVVENIELVEAPVAPKMCDPAADGVAVSISNEEFVAILRACLDFVNDNPIVKEFIAATGDFYTEEEIQEMWAWYQSIGLDETEEEFRARHQTLDAALAEAYEALGDAKLLDGEFTIGLYMNDAGELVFGVMNLPMHDGQQTEVMEVVYTRQTVAAGVAHVCNITVDGETVTIDALAAEASTVINLIAADGVKVLDITITNVGENKLFAVMNAYEGDEVIFFAGIAGECEFTDTKQYIGGKLELTSYDGVSAGETMVFTLTSDYDIDGVDFSGVTAFGFEFDGVSLTLQIAEQTAEPQEAIMAGAVTRPAELDDAAFQTWFVGVVNNLSVALTNALTALPESVLMLLLSSGAV